MSEAPGLRHAVEEKVACQAVRQMPVMDEDGRDAVLEAVEKVLLGGADGTCLPQRLYQCQYRRRCSWGKEEENDEFETREHYYKVRYRPRGRFSKSSTLQ
jgi:hypothetical protein